MPAPTGGAFGARTDDVGVQGSGSNIDFVVALASSSTDAGIDLIWPQSQNRGTLSLGLGREVCAVLLPSASGRDMDSAAIMKFVVLCRQA